MSVSVGITSEWQRVVERSLAGVRTAVESGLPRVLERVQDIAFESYGRQFQSAGGEFGSSWAQLTDATIARKIAARAKAPERILVRRGLLEGAMTRSGRRGGRTRKRKEQLQIEVGLVTASGGSLLAAVEKKRGVRRMPYGIAGRGLRDIDRVWAGYAKHVEKGFLL